MSAQGQPRCMPIVLRVNSFLNAGKSPHVTEHFMRGLLMALFAFDFPGHGLTAPAGVDHARARSTKTSAKKTTATTV